VDLSRDRRHARSKRHLPHDESWLVPKRGDGAPLPFLFKSTDLVLETWTPVTITGNLSEVDALEFTPTAVWAVAGSIYSS
jgi:hypothetical protein